MKKFFLILLVLMLCISSFACDKKDEPLTKQGFFFDTVINITVDEKDMPAAEAAFTLCHELENTFSRTKNGSELHKINNQDISSLSTDMKKVLEFAFSISEMTDGAFDVTVAPLTDLWDIKKRTVPPTKEELDTALVNVGYKKVSLQPFESGSSSIDLGAVAKGYAADCVAKLLKEKGVKHAIIDLGGNVALIGEYTVGITNPFDKDSLFARITLKDKSVVTSGAYQRYFEYEGKRYHHIIDPRTGMCADSGIASVTIISPSSMQADALSTAIFVLGQDSISLCKSFADTDAFIIMENGDIITTEGFDQKYKTEYFNQ